LENKDFIFHQGNAEKLKALERWDTCEQMQTSTMYMSVYEYFKQDSCYTQSGPVIYSNLWIIIWRVALLNSAKAKQRLLCHLSSLPRAADFISRELHFRAMVKHKAQAWFITSWLLQFQRYQCLEDPQNTYPMFTQTVQGTK